MPMTIPLLEYAQLAVLSVLSVLSCFVSLVSVLSDAWMSHHSHRTLQPLDAMAWKCDESNSPWLIEVS